MEDRPRDIELIADRRNLCGEAPIWDAAHRRLVWVDLSSSLVFEWQSDTGQSAILQRDLMVTGVALGRNGTLVFAGATGLHVWRGADNWRTLHAAYAGQPLFFNDILADSRGCIYAGTYYWDGTCMVRPGSLYLLDAAGRVEVFDDGIELANGLALSPDDRTLYFADSAARTIWAYDVDPETGTLSRKRTFVNVPPSDGLPDGITTDAEGCVWAALWYTGQVVRYDPAGTVERRIHLPVLQVSSVAFGGPDRTELFVTTAVEPWPSPLAPASYDPSSPNMGGGLYRIATDIQGRPEHVADI